MTPSTGSPQPSSARTSPARFGGRAALEEFTELRWIPVQDTERRYPI
jgi:hypothetical protein